MFLKTLNFESQTIFIEVMPKDLGLFGIIFTSLSEKWCFVDFDSCEIFKSKFSINEA